QPAAAYHRGCQCPAGRGPIIQGGGGRHGVSVRSKTDFRGQVQPGGSAQQGGDKTMNALRFTAIVILGAALTSGAAAQQNKASDNAALRYWSAFAQMQDTGITEQQAKEAHAILDGTAPYDDSKYKDIVEKNRPAVETMIRGTALPYCDWGVEMQMGPH